MFSTEITQNCVVSGVRCGSGNRFLMDKRGIQMRVKAFGEREKYSKMYDQVFFRLIFFRIKCYRM